MDTVNSKEHHLIENHTNPIKKEDVGLSQNFPRTKLFSKKRYFHFHRRSDNGKSC